MLQHIKFDINRQGLLIFLTTLFILTVDTLTVLVVSYKDAEYEFE